MVWAPICFCFECQLAGTDLLPWILYWVWRGKDASIMVTTAPETGAKYMRYYQSSRTVFIFSCFVLFHIIIITKIKKARIQKNPTPSITNTVTSLPFGFFFFSTVFSLFFPPPPPHCFRKLWCSRVCFQNSRSANLTPTLGALGTFRGGSLPNVNNDNDKFQEKVRLQHRAHSQHIFLTHSS